MAGLQKFLIVNADDFGLSAGVNAGVVEAHERGIVTSASLMVRGPAATEAASLARSHPRLSVGLHIDLAEWTYADEEWRLAYQVVPLDDPGRVAQEITRQLQVFQDLAGRAPTHLDSHQHVHHSEPIATIMRGEAQKRGLVLRVVDSVVRYCGDFYGQSNKGYPYPDGISVDGMRRILQKMPPGVTELGCHPAKGSDMPGMYCQEREVECATLCHPDVRAALSSEGIQLCSFSNWRSHWDDLTVRTL